MRADDGGSVDAPAEEETERERLNRNFSELLQEVTSG
jgi:hypothetical protein